MTRFEKDLFPWLAGRPIAEIKAPELLAVLRRIESRGALETAHRAMQNCGQVFRYGVATGRAERDPTGDLRGALPPPKEEHHASIIEPKRIGELLRAIDAYEGFFVTVPNDADGLERDPALRVAREAFMGAELTLADAEAAVRKVRRKRHGSRGMQSRSSGSIG